LAVFSIGVSEHDRETYFLRLFFLVPVCLACVFIYSKLLWVIGNQSDGYV